MTQELNLLDVNGQRLADWLSESRQVAKTLPEFLELAGEDGWELVSHTITQDTQFKRPKTA